MKIFKKRQENRAEGFIFDENTQEYQVPGFRFLYDNPDQFLELYKLLYDNVTVFDSAIETYTSLINGGWVIEADDPGIIDTVKYDILNKTNFNEKLDIHISESFIYGFSGTEVVLSDNLREIEKFQDIPSKELRFKRDNEGNIIEFYAMGARPTRAMSKKRIMFDSHSATADNPYGRSLFKSLPFLTRIMVEIQDSMGKIYKRYGSPRYFVNYKPDVQLDDKTLKTRMDAIKSKFNQNLTAGKDFFGTGELAITVIGADGQKMDFKIETSEIMQGVFAGLKLPAGVLGYNYGSTETHLKSQIEILLGRCVRYQNMFATKINNFLMPMVAAVYNLPEIPVFKFKQPIIVDELAEEEVESRKIDNMLKLVEAELITKEQAKAALDI